MTRSLYIAGSLMAIGMSALFADNGTQVDESNSVVLKCIRSDSQDKLEVRFGDVIAVTSELSFMHSDGSKTTASARNGVVELRNGTSTITGKKVAFSLRDGWLGSRGGRDKILKSIIGTTENAIE